MTGFPKLLHTSVIGDYRCLWSLIEDEEVKYIGIFRNKHIDGPVTIFVSEGCVEEDVEEFGWNSLEEMFDDCFKDCLEDFI